MFHGTHVCRITHASKRLLATGIAQEQIAVLDLFRIFENFGDYTGICCREKGDAFVLGFVHIVLVELLGRLMIY